VRRPGPRPLSNALAGALAGARPATLLARVQAAWPEVAGRPLATGTAPVAEREGVVTIACESALWAHELELLQRDLLDRLAERLEASGEGSVERLRFTVGSLPNHP
jgi:predicted nucleic acid-binding Zn ribbon protein